MLIIQNDALLDYLRNRYTLHQLNALSSFLSRHATFEFPMLPTGLFSAARLTGDNHYTGYDNVWIRDNVHIAHAHLVSGRPKIAVRNITALRLYLRRHLHRFSGIIRGDADPSNPMNRPHVRFNGCELQENPEKWSHAQNDALGYFCWLFCRLAAQGHLELHDEDWDLLSHFVVYFQTVRYWEDEDSGHWEEARKIEASSIGTVVASLRDMRSLMAAHSIASLPNALGTVHLQTLDRLISQGTEVLNGILPSECIQSDPAKRRRYDAALLFLIYPLQVVTREQAEQICHDVETQLLGDYGIRRYLGDSFWCADYKALQAPETRTSDVSDDMSSRNALLKPDQEAQWCIFDPVLSTIYGRLYQTTKSADHLAKQIHYLNRSIGQLTGRDSGFAEFLCPELYYLEGNRRVANDVTPLLWTQANLMVALQQMRQSICPSGNYCA